MSKPVRLAREARAELHEAARRYSEQRPDLRIEFLAAVDEAMERLVRLAKHLSSPPGIDPTLGIKRISHIAPQTRSVHVRTASRQAPRPHREPAATGKDSLSRTGPDRES
jgi:serine/threonine protein kinase HipA of HipAB toxin-antitoxin module